MAKITGTGKYDPDYFIYICFFFFCLNKLSIIPVIEFEPWSPVRGAQDGLDSTGQVYKEVAHQEKPTAQKACVVNQYPLDKPSPRLFINCPN